MADPFVAEIRIFGFEFAPTGWALCNGQILPISQNTALFSLLGTVYGGDGKSTFALPNIQGCAVMHPGQGQGLSERWQGEEGGTETVSLLVSEIPVHTHTLMGTVEDATQGSLTAGVIPSQAVNGNLYQTNSTQNLVQLALAQALAPAGGGLPHNNMMPYLVMNYCIALQGIFPARP
jgi:microcystin-dependent protein